MYKYNLLITTPHKAVFHPSQSLHTPPAAARAASTSLCSASRSASIAFRASSEAAVSTAASGSSSGTALSGRVLTLSALPSPMGPSMLPLLLPLARGGGGGGTLPPLNFRAGGSEDGRCVLPLLRTDVLRCGGGGGGVNLAKPALRDVDELLASALGSLLPGLPGMAGNGYEGDLRCVEAGLEYEGDCRWLAARRGGGGAGPARLTRRLDDRDRCDSSEDLGGSVTASSNVSVSVASLLSLLACPCRLGGGAGFLNVEEGFEIGVDAECDALGGVGGLGGGAVSASGSMSISGSFPAASVSKMLFLWSSSGRVGGGGNGLFTSVGLPSDDLLGEVGDAVICPVVGRRSRVTFSSFVFSSTLINFPCLVAGGGGGFLRDPDR